MIIRTLLLTPTKMLAVARVARVVTVVSIAFAVLFAVLFAAPRSAVAQTASGGASSTSAATGGVDGDDLGAGTRRLLALQVSGRAAAPGPIQPVPGDEATVAYKRYLDSFSHAVPEFFEQKVKSNAGS